MHLPLDQVGHEDIGHKEDRRGGVLEVVQQGQDARLAGHGHRQVDVVDVVLFDEGGQLAHLADGGQLAGVGQAVQVAVIKKAHHAGAQVRVVLKLAAQVKAHIVHPGHHRSALALAGRERPQQQPPRHKMRQHHGRGGEHPPGPDHALRKMPQVAAGITKAPHDHHHQQPVGHHLAHHPARPLMKAHIARKQHGKGEHRQQHVMGPGHRVFDHHAERQGEHRHQRVEQGLHRRGECVARAQKVLVCIDRSEHG